VVRTAVVAVLSLFDIVKSTDTCILTALNNLV
jgi:hypothetical protein